MNLHVRKMIAPIIIIICLVSYYLILLYIMLKLKLPTLFNIGIIGITVIVTFILIWVLIDRIKEIRRGEEDDLSQY